MKKDHIVTKTKRPEVPEMGWGSKFGKFAQGASYGAGFVKTYGDIMSAQKEYERGRDALRLQGIGAETDLYQQKTSIKKALKQSFEEAHQAYGQVFASKATDQTSSGYYTNMFDIGNYMATQADEAQDQIRSAELNFNVTMAELEYRKKALKVQKKQKKIGAILSGVTDVGMIFAGGM